MRTLLPALLIVALLATPGLAQIRYSDDEGVTHWVDSPDQVPERFRVRATGRPTPPPQPAGINWEQQSRDLQRQADAERTKRQAQEAEQARQLAAQEDATQRAAAAEQAEAARQVAHSVTYVVKGNGTSAALTYANEQGGTVQETVRVPWHTSFDVRAGAFLYLSATTAYGDGVAVEILVDGSEFKRAAGSASAAGGAVSARASGSCC